MTETRRLTFYVNPLWRRVGFHTPLLNPWWGNPYEDVSVFAKQLFDANSFDTKYYDINDDIKMADMVLPPYPYVWYLRHNIALFNECVKTAREANLPLLIDGVGDIDYPIEIENAYVLRYGGYRFLQDPRRIQIPPLADDFLERYREGLFQIREKVSDKPVVGFSGWASLSPMQILRTVIKELPVRLRGVFDVRYRACTKGVLWRRKATNILKRSTLVNTNFQTRSSFSANVKTAHGDIRQLREEMIDTILQSDYALDVRGDANDSTRLFEILSLGRIPVIVDTERNFPFKDKVDYSSFALIVDFRDIKNLPERIAEFHKNILPEQFKQMQINARNAFVNYFRIDALMRHLVEELRARLSTSSPKEASYR